LFFLDLKGVVPRYEDFLSEKHTQIKAAVKEMLAKIVGIK